MEDSNLADLPQGLQMTEEEHMEKIRRQMKSNIVYHLTWCLLSCLIILYTPDDSCQIPVHLLLIIRMSIRLFYSLPFKVISYYLAKQRVINPSSVSILSTAVATPLFFWYTFMVILFFTKYNDCKESSFPLYLGLLLLVVESILYLIFFILISMLLCCIGILTSVICFIKWRNKNNNKKISNLLLKAKGLRKDPRECEHAEECCICFGEFGSDSKVICLPCNDKHYFHSKCISEWMKTRNSCPICKSVVTVELLKQYKKKRPVVTEMQRINTTSNSSAVQ
ncbi:unnamed protein product [Moneuplotes crassus]|uniref:RING-type domain-containing protein n=1 Tax=Euplotes crassus TaxID=5936 RepID=A0AAD2D279_EUPCR|nr:unnamed protein product [Moneuplotes crassus]